MSKVAVVLMNLGGPDSLDAVRPFLFNLFNDPAIFRLPQPFRAILAAMVAKRRTKVASEILMGPYLVVHDEAKMERGEPCTSIYPLETPTGGEEAVVSFHCIPHPRPVVGKFTFATSWDYVHGMYIMTEYQFAGDTEGHGVPTEALVSDPLPVRTLEMCAR